MHQLHEQGKQELAPELDQPCSIRVMEPAHNSESARPPDVGASSLGLRLGPPSRGTLPLVLLSPCTSCTTLRGPAWGHPRHPFPVVQVQHP